jgi:hypothetical protein
VLGDLQGELLQAGPLDGLTPAEQLAQHVPGPASAVAGGVFLPLPVLLAEPFQGAGVEGLQVGPFGGEHRDGQEWPGDLNQLQPVDVRLAALARRHSAVVRVAAGSAAVSAAWGRHRVASRRGTAKITATGKECGRTSR